MARPRRLDKSEGSNKISVAQAPGFDFAGKETDNRKKGGGEELPPRHPEKSEMINLPNLLSIARILCVPLFIILLLNHLYGWALFTFIAASITDAIDGLLARVLNQKTVLGSYLDPAADKLLNASSYTALAVFNLVPSWLAVIVVSRDVIICVGLMILFWTSHPLEIRPSIASKLTTIFQFCTIIAALLLIYAPPPHFMGGIRDVLIWATAAGTIISGLQYILRGVRIFNQGEGR